MSNHAQTVAARFAAHAKPATLADLANTTIIGKAAHDAFRSALVQSADLDKAGEAAEGRAIADAADASRNSELGLAALTFGLITSALKASDADFQNPDNKTAVNEAITMTLRRHAEVRDAYAAQAINTQATAMRAAGITMTRVMDDVDRFDARGDVSADDWYKAEETALAATHSAEAVKDWRAAHERIARTQRSMIGGFLACGKAGLLAVDVEKKERSAVVADTRRWASILREVAREAHKAGRTATEADCRAAIAKAEQERADKAAAGKDRTIMDDVGAAFAKLASLERKATKDKAGTVGLRLSIIAAHARQIGLIGDAADQDFDPNAASLQSLIALMGDVVKVDDKPEEEKPDVKPVDADVVANTAANRRQRRRAARAAQGVEDATS